MKKNESITIRRAANGFIVEPVVVYSDMVREDQTLFVFDDYEDMVEFVSIHFERVKNYDECYEDNLESKTKR